MAKKARTMVNRASISRTSGALVCGLAAAIACGQPAVNYGPEGEIEFKEDRPQLRPADAPPPTYSGSNEFVLEAQALHPTGLHLHKNVIIRTCGPTQGVCHNQKEYPDLHTPSNLLETVDAACNVQPGDWSAVFDGCELPGDRLRISDSRTVEIGWVDYIIGDGDYGDGNKPDRESPGLHIELQEPIQVGGDRGSGWGAARFIRSFVENGQIDEITYSRYETEWFLLEGGTHVVGEVREYQAERVTSLVTQGIEQGDMNRNGIFGARESTSLALLAAGDPTRSYLIGRLRGELNGTDIPGTRMPLANEPLSIADMLALYCFVEGLPSDLDKHYDMTTPINYEDCQWAADPEGLNLLGKGATWLGRVQPLIEANCGGCHGGENPEFGFDVISEGAYERLFETSKQSPEMPYITPGDPEQSYLWVKITEGAGLVGFGMPLDSNNQARLLPQGALADIETWIMNGAAAEE